MAGGGGGPPRMRGMILAAVAGLIGLAAWTSYYTVPSDSVAVVQRFGKYLKEVPPGLHFKLPIGADVATLVPVKRQLKQEFGFSTPGGGDPYQTPTDGRRETEMVTGYLNAALVEWVVQYRISDPVKFLFEAYNGGPEAVAFYEFTRTMQAYKDMITEDTTLILSTDSDLFKFLKGMNPDRTIGVGAEPPPGDDVARRE